MSKKPHYSHNNKFYPSYWKRQMLADLVRNHRELRLDDNPCFMGTIQEAILFQDDFDDDDQEFLNQVIAQQTSKRLLSKDIFWPNYPVPGSLNYPDDFIRLGIMPTQDRIGLFISQLCRNVITLGAAGTAKTSLWMKVLARRELLENVCVIAFVRKPEIRELCTIPNIQDLIYVFRLTIPPEFHLPFGQFPGAMPEKLWASEVTQLFAKCYGRYSAQRLMAQVMFDLMGHRPKDHFPTPENIRDALLAFKPSFQERRQADYKESILTCLSDLIHNTEGLWASHTTFLDRLFAKPGLYVFEAESLAQEHLSFITTLVMRYLYFKKIYGG